MSQETIAKTLPLTLRAHIKASMPHSAMIFAAGLGTRMLPLTEDRPKALVEVGERPLIDYSLQHLEGAGVQNVVVNLHAHAERLQEYLKDRGTKLNIQLSDERDTLLDTGGGLKKAVPLLGEGPVFTLNCDAFWQDGLVDTLAHLASRWDPDVMDALLLIVHSCNAIGYKGRGDFEMDALGRLAFRAERKITPYVYAGVQIVKPELATDIEDDVFSMRRIWEDAAERNRLYGLIHEGRWAHVGTPDAVGLVERKLLD